MYIHIMEQEYKTILMYPLTACSTSSEKAKTIGFQQNNKPTLVCYLANFWLTFVDKFDFSTNNLLL